MVNKALSDVSVLRLCLAHSEVKEETQMTLEDQENTLLEDKKLPVAALLKIKRAAFQQHRIALCV